MAAFGIVAFPMGVIEGLVGVDATRGLRPVAVGTKGVKPDIGVKGESPGVVMGIGVNMPDIVGIMPIPTGQKAVNKAIKLLRLNIQQPAYCLAQLM